MSTRFIVSAVVGVVVGYVSGSPQAGFQAFALTYGATGSLDPNQKVVGPRLDDLKGPKAAYGAPIPYIEGAPRTAGASYIWNSDKRAIANETTADGKGGPGVDTTTYTYEIDCLILFSINELAALRRVWSNGKLIWTAADDSDEESVAASAETDSWRRMTFYTGDAAQLPDPTYEAAVGVGNAPAYRGRASVFVEGLNLGPSGQLPILTFEVCSQATITSFPATTRLQSYFAGNSSADISSFENGGGAFVGNATCVDDALVITFPGPDEPSYLEYTLADIAGDGESPITVEMIVEYGETPNIASTIAKYLPNASDPDTFYNWAWYGDSGRILFQPYGGFEGPVTPAPVGGKAHLAIVFGEGSVRAYVNSVLLYEAGVSGIQSTAVNGQLTLGDRLGTSYYTITTNWKIHEFAVRFEEMYPGQTFPTPWDLEAPEAQQHIKPPDGADELVTADLIPLDEVVSRLCLRTGLLTVDDFDVTDLEDDFVRAMALTQVGSTRQAIETLMGAYFFEAVEGQKLTFVKRGKASALTIPYADLGASGSSPVEPLPVQRNSDVELPARVSVKFANMANDFQDGVADGDRLVTDSTSNTVIEFPLGFLPGEAKKIADANTMDLAVSIVGIGPVQLTREHAAIEPADILTLVGEDGSTYRCRPQKITDSGGVRILELVLDDASAINSVAVTDENYESSTLVRSIPATVSVRLDIPILRDADNDQGFYVAAKGESTPWPGAVEYSSRDDVTYAREVSITESAVFGVCTTILGDWDGPRVRDTSSSVTVSVGAGTLSSSTWDALLNDQAVNACAIGVDGRWELCQFLTADLVTAGVYELRGFLRGSRGTESQMVDHVADERFVLLRPAGMRRILIDTSAIGAERYYKSVSIGKSIASVTGVPFTDNAIGLKPFSPFDARKETDAGTGDITLTWQRRTRLSTRIIGPAGISIPLGEEVEAYSVDILSSDSDESVIRTIASSTTSLVYTAAMQSEDGHVPGNPLFVRIYQLSAMVGRGYPLQAAA